MNTNENQVESWPEERKTSKAVQTNQRPNKKENGSNKSKTAQKSQIIRIFLHTEQKN